MKESAQLRVPATLPHRKNPGNLSGPQSRCGSLGEEKNSHPHKTKVVLYGCETWPLTLRKKRRLRVFENRVLRRIFWFKGNEVTGEWRKLHNEELNDLYCSPNIFRVIKLRILR